MKTLKFLFATIVLVWFVGLAQTNAQVLLNNKYEEEVPISYEVDGELYVAFAICEAHPVLIANGMFNSRSQGYLSDSEVYKWDDTIGDWVLIDYLPLPKTAISGTDLDYPDVWVLITPSGEVTLKKHADLW